MATCDCAAGCGLKTEITSFLDELTAAGYVPQRLTQRRSILFAFTRWVQDQHLAVGDLSEVHVAAFVAYRSRGQETRKKGRATLRRFLTHLRRRRRLLPQQRCVASPAASLRNCLSTAVH
jgi:hypothetical protein